MTTTRLGPFATATDMLLALRTRQISSVELLDLHLRRIERYNPALNAIVTPDYDDARHTAEKADEKRTSGDDAPLLGLPLTIKDCINVEGLPTTAGIRARASSLPQADSRVTARVRAAGAVIMGKTNVPPYASDWQANNRLFGRTNNPWDTGRSPGGSTGGGAAALAAGLTPLEFGSDIGGSIRIPAAFCGVYGHKPSETAVPRSGHFPGTPLPNAATGMAVQGPLARSAEDLELALDVISGPDVGEDIAWHLNLPPARHERLADFRVAVLSSFNWLPVDSEILAAQARLIEQLGAAGVTVKETQVEGLGDMHDYYLRYYALLATMMSIGRPRWSRFSEAFFSRMARNEFLRAYADGLEASASDYALWFGQRERYRAAYRAFFREWDILIAPADITCAFPHTDAPFSSRTLTLNGQKVPYYLQSAYPSMATLTGQPATAFPVGLSKAGLPIGLQAIGPYLEDRTTIRFAALVAQELGGFQSPPGYE